MGIARNIARLVPNGSGLLPNANIEAVAASKLTGQVPDANAPSGSIVQVLQWSYNSVYENFAQNSEYALPSPFGDGSMAITPSNANNKIRVQAQINCGQEDTWRANYFKFYYAIGGGGSTHFGGASAIGYIENHSGGMTSIYFDYLLSLNTTSSVAIRVNQVGSANGGYLHLNQNNYSNAGNNNNTINAYTTVTLTEITA